MLVSNDDPGAIRQRSSKVSPRHQSRKIKNRIRQTLRRQLSQTPKKKRKHAHSQQRLQNHPSHANYSLLVAHLNIAPNKKVKQFPILPKLPQPQLKQPMRWLNANHSRHTGRNRKSIGSADSQRAACRRRCSNGSHQVFTRNRKCQSIRRLCRSLGFSPARDRRNTGALHPLQNIGLE